MDRLTKAISRRHWLGSAYVGISAGSLSGWLRALAADTPSRPAKSVIVLWLNGGPATIDLWDLKPGHKNGGPFQAIQTTVPGMSLCEHLPQLAKHGNKLALIRSMTTKEGDHNRATFLLRTGYTPQGAVHFPSLGSVMAKELGSASSNLPNFVSIAPGLHARAIGGGFLGPKFAPLIIAEGAQLNGSSVAQVLRVPDLERSPDLSEAAQASRLDLLGGMNRAFQTTRSSSVTDSIQAATERALRLMQPEAASAFRLDRESAPLREAYGRNLFGQGCLLARRLVERGVPFVEVTLDGWDTHQNNFDQVKELSTVLDAGFSTLVTDLEERGLLEETLIICQGEFGRTPHINGQAGRDHWPASWCVMLAGGGIKTGQVIGRTSADGTIVEDRPVSVPDLVATVAMAAKIDPQKQNMSNVGRPISVAQHHATPILELL